MITVANIWRHPIKSHGREALERVALTAGQSMPWDRHWAVTHEATKFDVANPEWVMCRNFMIGALVPDLAGIWANLDETTGTIALRHDRLGTVTFRPDDAADAARFLNWVEPLTHAVSTKPAAVVSLDTRGVTDTDYPSVSIMTKASHAAVSTHLGGALEPERWRGNFWLDGANPWEEFDWIGRDIAIGDTVLRVHGPIKRCKHTSANPRTGDRDADTLGVLNDSFGHQNFGVYAQVIQGGQITLGAQTKVL